MLQDIQKAFPNQQVISSVALSRFNRAYYERANAGELTRIGSRSFLIQETDTPTSMSVQKYTEKEAIDTIVNSYEEIEKRFNMLNILGNGLVSGHINALMVAGAPGVGKTFELENKLMKASEDGVLKSYTPIKGSISAIVLYEKLFEARERGNVILLDDCDSIYSDEECMNLLKAALDTSVVRRVSWCKASRYLEDREIPQAFDFRGQVVFITNVDPDKIIMKDGKFAPHMKALISRTTFLDLCIHQSTEIIMRVEQVMKNSTLCDDLELTTEQGSTCIQWMKSNLNRIRSVSIRTVIQLAQFIKTSDQWEDIANATLLRRA